MRQFAETIIEYFKKYFPYIAVFSASMYNPGDTDLGWHLKYGEYFFKNFHPLWSNTFSSMMAGYNWVNSSWATDLVTYAVYQVSGFFGLSILGAFVITLTFAVISRTGKFSLWEKAIIFPILLNLEYPLFSVSFRGHLLSLLLLCILVFILNKFSEKKTRLVYLIPFLFILWSNLHGEFILGLCVLGLWTILSYVRTLIGITENAKFLNSGISHKIKRTIQSDYALPIVTGISLLSSMINPFSYKVYIETFRHFANPLQKYVVEWLPLESFTPAWWKLVAWGLILAVTVIFTFKKEGFRKNFSLFALALILLLLSFWMRRYAWAMFLVSSLVIKIFVSRTQPKSGKVVLAVSSVILIVMYFYNIFIRIPGQHFMSMNWDNYCRWYAFCSQKSAEYIIINPPEGNILTFYNWGGWLIWKYPQIIPSIDGRMHLWTDEKGYSAFYEYYGYEQDWTDVEKSGYKAVYINRSKPLYFRMLKLADSGNWKKVYEDDLSAVFYKNPV